MFLDFFFSFFHSFFFRFFNQFLFSFFLVGWINLIFHFFFSELDSYELRVAEVTRLVNQLPEAHKRMLLILCCHLEKVAAKCCKNMMTVANLAVCFGPTLLRDKEETVAALMKIQSSNIVVEILLENWRQMFNFAH